MHHRKFERQEETVNLRMSRELRSRLDSAVDRARDVVPGTRASLGQLCRDLLRRGLEQMEATGGGVAAAEDEPKK